MIDHFSASLMPIVNSEQNGVSVLAEAVALRGIHTSDCDCHPRCRFSAVACTCVGVHRSTCSHTEVLLCLSESLEAEPLTEPETCGFGFVLVPPHNTGITLDLVVGVAEFKVLQLVL